MAPRRRPNKKNPRMDAAIDRMAELGFPRQLIRQKVKELLKVYGEDGWFFIEDGSYKVLLQVLLPDPEGDEGAVVISEDDVRGEAGPSGAGPSTGIHQSSDNDHMGNVAECSALGPSKGLPQILEDGLRVEKADAPSDAGPSTRTHQSSDDHDNHIENFAECSAPGSSKGLPEMLEDGLRVGNAAAPSTPGTSDGIYGRKVVKAEPVDAVVAATRMMESGLDSLPHPQGENGEVGDMDLDPHTNNEQGSCPSGVDNGIDQKERDTELRSGNLGVDDLVAAENIPVKMMDSAPKTRVQGRKRKSSCGWLDEDDEEEEQFLSLPAATSGRKLMALVCGRQRVCRWDVRPGDI